MDPRPQQQREKEITFKICPNDSDWSTLLPASRLQHPALTILAQETTYKMQRYLRQLNLLHNQPG